jgi:hypothetical protein
MKIFIIMIAFLKFFDTMVLGDFYEISFHNQSKKLFNNKQHNPNSICKKFGRV